MMKFKEHVLILVFGFLTLMFSAPIHAWSKEGHIMTCQIAQVRKIIFIIFFVFCDFYFIVMNFVEFVGAGGGGGRDKVVTGVCERRLVEFMYMA